MAFKTVADLQDSVAGQLTGLDLNNVTNLFTAFERAARQLSHYVDVPDSRGRQEITIYDGVIDYPAPSDIFGANLIDFQTQGISRLTSDYVYKQPISEFDRTKGALMNGTSITFENRLGVPIIRIESVKPTPRIELDPFTETTGWTAGGTASVLTQDSSVFYQSPAALRFILTGSGTGTLTKTIPSVDLTEYKNVGVGFAAYRTPSITNLTSIELRIGSSASAYYTKTVTSAFLGAFLLNQWDLASFDFSTATTVGVPDITKITYVQILIAHTDTITNMYLGDLWIALPSPSILIYASTAFFQASGKNPSKTITTKADNIILSDDLYALYEVEAAILVAEQQGGTLASGLIETLQEKLNGIRGYRGVMIQPGLLDIYRANNPSQTLRTISNWYD
jgi:hypothetical protein